MSVVVLFLILWAVVLLGVVAMCRASARGQGQRPAVARERRTPAMPVSSRRVAH